MPNKANLRSIEYTDAQTWPQDTDREYFFIYVVSGSVLMEFGGTGGQIPLTAGGFYEPTAIPTGSIAITPDPTATYIVNSDTHP